MDAIGAVGEMAGCRDEGFGFFKGLAQQDHETRYH
jgi:hypothetical protein